MRTIRFVFVLPILCFVLTPRHARAQNGYSLIPEEPRDAEPPPAVIVVGAATDERPSPRFGAQGQVVLGTSAGLSFASREYDNSEASYRSATISPAFDVFAVDDFSIGVDLTAALSEGKGYGADGSLVTTDATTYAAGARLGYVVHLGERVSWWPRIEVGFESAHVEEHLSSGNSYSVASSPLGYPSTTNDGPYVSLSMPLLFHVAPHFFFGVGPTLFRELSSTKGGPDVGGQRTTIGGTFTTGGYFGGVREAGPLVASSPAPVPAARFGDAGQIVLTGELSSTSIGATTYEGTGSSTFGFGVSPGFDYFVANHVSIGGAIYGSYSSTKSIDASSGAAVQLTSASFEARLRLGVDVPLASWLSWYPRAFVGVGMSSYDETSAGSENKDSRSIVDIGVTAPILVHPVPHYFVGFGPSAYHELQGSDEFGRDIRATTLGASLVVGGWLATADSRRAP